MDEIVITEPQIIPVKPRDGLIAFASCVFNHHLYLGNIALYTSPSSKDGYRLVYPARILVTGKQIHSFHPITKEAGKILKEIIINKYANLIKNM